VGATTDAVERLYWDDLQRATAAGYTVARVAWDATQPEPTLLVDYVRAGVREPSRLPRRFSVVGVFVVAALIVFSTLTKERQVVAPDPTTPLTAAQATSGRIDATPSPRPTAAPTVRPTAAPTVRPHATLPASPGIEGVVVTVTPSPTASPTERVSNVKALPVQPWSEQIGWRWLGEDEFDCADRGSGCWGLLVRTSETCQLGLTATIGLFDDAGRRVGSITDGRRPARRDRDIVLIFDAPSSAASAVRLQDIRCERALRPTPTPTRRASP
jgi:hypothetical protein